MEKRGRGRMRRMRFDSEEEAGSEAEQSSYVLDFSIPFAVHFSGDDLQDGDANEEFGNSGLDVTRLDLLHLRLDSSDHVIRVDSSGQVIFGGRDDPAYIPSQHCFIVRSNASSEQLVLKLRAPFVGSRSAKVVIAGPDGVLRDFRVLDGGESQEGDDILAALDTAIFAEKQTGEAVDRLTANLREFRDWARSLQSADADQGGAR
jgi:hypothetical protein